MDYPDAEQSRDPTPDESTLPDQPRLVEEIRAPTANVPVVSEPSPSTVQTEAGRKISSIDQIVMLTEQLLEATCQWKEEHNGKEKETKIMAELNKRLGRAEEALERIRAERDVSLCANEKKDAEITKVRTELTKAQAYVTEYLMKEEELIRDAAEAKAEVERIRKEHGKHTGEINSLQRRLQHAKKERKDEATAFEHQLRTLRQELREQEKTWSTKEKKFTEDAVNMTTDLRKLKAEVEEQRAETERMSTELTKKSNRLIELQKQLG